MPVPKKASSPIIRLWMAFSLIFMIAVAWLAAGDERPLGSEHAIERHLQDGEEFSIPMSKLLEFGKAIFAANWTIQDGAGRPLTKGTGAPLSDPTRPLVFPSNFNRVSGPDANSCAGCHNAPFGIPGGGGDIVANVFVLGQRFDFATMAGDDFVPTRGAVDEAGIAVTLQSIANSRATLGMFGSGYIEMLARQMTADLIAIRDALQPGQSAALVCKGVSFGTLSRQSDGSWDTTRVVGLPSPSLASAGPAAPPSLIIRPFHQAGAVISLRQFSNNAFNHHHGMQSEERFGIDTDPDGDGVRNELTRADITAATLYQATLAVPGRRIPNDRRIEQAVWKGEQLFGTIGCTSCHVPELPLDSRGWIFTEPNPFNPPGNLRIGEAPTLAVDLNSEELPLPRLSAEKGVTHVPAYTDLKLHDLTDGPNDPNREVLDMLPPAGSKGFFAGNSRFITRKLWGTANEPPFFHHGKFTTMREAVLAHGGEAKDSRRRFRDELSDDDRNAVIEFLKSLQVLPPGTRWLIVDENGHRRNWPPTNGVPTTAEAR
jgi:Di-haem oxidoreductase, putative peroxidase